MGRLRVSKTHPRPLPPGVMGRSGCVDTRQTANSSNTCVFAGANISSYWIMATMALATEVDMFSRSSLLGKMPDALRQSFREGKLPLFVLGSGISATQVPLLSEMTNWFLRKIDELITDRQLKAQLLEQGSLICKKRATRADAAGFFSALQMTESDSNMEQIWHMFTEELTITGLPKSDLSRYEGLFRLSEANCTQTHHILARLLAVRQCHILNLNYDPLLLLASRKLQQESEGSLDVFVPLYSVEDITSYYTAHRRNTPQLQASVTNARGDVFFAKCINPLCPQRHNHRVIEPNRFAELDDVFLCPVCHKHSSRLQLSFPGYEAKERIVKDITRSLQEYISGRISHIVCLGLSGQWDPFLLQELFAMASQCDIPLFDVRPAEPASNGGANYFEQLIQRAFPYIPDGYSEHCACFVRVELTADAFCEQLVKHVPDVPRNPSAPQPGLFK